MNDDPKSPDEAIFFEALDLPPGERQSYVESVAQDPKQRDRVLALLGAAEKPSFMDAPVPSQMEEVFARLKPEEAGDRIGNYKLLQNIGEGGFGVVWLAEQQRPIRRSVALKIIKLGMDTKDVIARFEQERHALAMMDHPNIAKVFDAGVTQFGRPYFVMELVQGVRITDYCDDKRLPTADRLNLFIQVCHAVQHAHQKGIIHRDIKPSNILVTVNDERAAPKVIDFGIAKATQEQRLTALTVLTQIEQTIGTPLYMSPEQAENRSGDIDTRTDIYSLGVLLYELLTGRTPFDTDEMKGCGLEEIRQAIREAEPLKPSDRLSALGPDLMRVTAGHRRSDRLKLIRSVRGDLDWIVLKALEKDRERRYGSAASFASDLQRHLRNEPVSARPPSPGYRLWRMARRNRVLFAAGGAVLAALTIGLGTALYALANERLAKAAEVVQRDLAESRARDAQISAAAAVANHLKARRFLYAADMKLVQHALSKNNIGRARALLDRHRPAGGEADLRGWEWRYLWHQCRSAARVQLSKREDTRVFSVALSGDGKWLAAAYLNGEIAFWDIREGIVRKAAEASSAEGHVAFAPGKPEFAASAGRGSVKVHEVPSGAVRTVFSGGGNIQDVAYSRDGALLIILTSGPDVVTIVKAENGETVFRQALLPGSGIHFNDARLSPDNRFLFVSSGAFKNAKLQCVSIEDGAPKWDVPIGVIEDDGIEQGPDIGFAAMDVSPDGHTVAVSTGYKDPRIRILDAESGEMVKSLRGHTGWVATVAFSQNGEMLISGSTDQTIRIWDTKTWRPKREPLRGHAQEVYTISLSPDASLLASGSKDGEVLLWDLQDMGPARGRRDLPRNLRTVQPLPIDDMLLVESREGNWSLMDLASGRVLDVTEKQRTVDGASIPLMAAIARRIWGELSFGESGSGRLSPDGKMLAIADQRGWATLADPVTRKPIEELRGDMGSVFGVGFSPDNRRLVLSAGGRDGVVIFDRETRQELLALDAPGALLSQVEFTPDANTLIVGSNANGRSEQVTQCWRAPSWAEIDEAEKKGGRWPCFDIAPQPKTFPSATEIRESLAAECRRQLAAAADSRGAHARLRVMNTLVELLRAAGRHDEAESMLREYARALVTSTSFDRASAIIAAIDLACVRLTATEGPSGAKSFATARQSDDLITQLLRKLDSAVGEEPSDMLFGLKVCVLQVWFGMQDEHRSLVNRLFKLAAKLGTPDAASKAARAYALRPMSDDQFRSAAIAFAKHARSPERTQPMLPWAHVTCGLVEYRLKNFSDAIKASNAAEAGADAAWNPTVLRPTILLLRAMALCREGDATGAIKSLEQAEALVPESSSELMNLSGVRGDHDLLALRILQQEARELITSSK